MEVQQVTEDEFECAICMECLTHPCRIHPCQHIYCLECLQTLRSHLDSQCPQCRTEIQYLAPALDVEQRMSQSCVTCSDCSTKVPALSVKQHKNTCSGVEKVKAILTQKTLNREIGNVHISEPNRSTFSCPYCYQSNLLCSQLIEHCSLLHRKCAKRVVCPVCSSMPWGDPDMKSSNFIKHLSKRHKFDYETFVDYDQDDDTMLQAALEASLQDIQARTEYV